MKRLIPILTLAILLATSCRKEYRPQTNDTFTNQLQQSLQEAMPEGVYGKLDFTKVIKTTINDSVMLVRVGFKYTSMDKEFVLLKMTAGGEMKNGQIIRINGGVTDAQEFEGDITVSDLADVRSSVSPISRGRIKKRLVVASDIQRESASPPPSMGYSFIELPEVIVVGVIPSLGGGGISVGTYLNLMSIASNFDTGGGSSGGGSGFYSNVNPFGSGGGGAGSLGNPANSSGGPLADDLLEFEAETIYSQIDVSITNMFKCFDIVPTAGATYKISLSADLPSNNSPTASANINGISAGHTFLTVTKENGGVSVTQSFGFYPKRSPSWTAPFSAISSTIKDNGSNEINASISMNLTAEQFQLIKINSIVWASKNYLLADYNCSDYAMNIFNSVRTNPLTVDPYEIHIAGNPYGANPTTTTTLSIDRSPQMLFVKLDQMKKSNDPEAANIRIDQSHDYRAPQSHGECN